MSSATQVLAAFASDLRFEQIPPEAVGRAKDCILDTVGVAIFGAALPWSRMVREYAQRFGSGGRSSVLAPNGGHLQAPSAALVNGTAAHAFELDSMRQPNAGAHPGATLLPAGLAIAQEEGASGSELIAAFVAGCEVLFRIGRAGRQSSDKLGFHGPAVTGALGAAVTAGKLLGLDADRMASALGIAASLAGGLLEGMKTGQGGMVKRLHLGRAAESGVLAACLAQSGYEGPHTILEGKHGYFNAYCREPDMGALTAGLGAEWETLNICMKRYACHSAVVTPVEALAALKVAHALSPASIAAITVEGRSRMQTHHNIAEPGDLATAQSSIPFCVALSLFFDPADPRSYSEARLTDPDILALARKVQIVPREPPAGSLWASRVTVRLTDGTEFAHEVRDFVGTPRRPMTQDELAAKFRQLCAVADVGDADTLLPRLRELETQSDLEWLAP